MKSHIDVAVRYLAAIQLLIVGAKFAEFLYRMKLYVVDCGWHRFFNHVDESFFTEYRSAFLISLVIVPLVLLWSQSRLFRWLSVGGVLLALTLLVSVTALRKQGVIISYGEFVAHGV